MGEKKRRMENQLISVLIPERGRPEMLERLIHSLIETAGDDERYEILVQIDEDDPAWEGRDPVMHPRTRYMRRERSITLGEKLNEMARASIGEIVWFISNDQKMMTHGWPTKFRQAVAKLPNGIGVPFVKDPLHPDHASYPILTRRMIETTGFAFAPWFPAWYIDTWIDQIGILTGIRFEIDVEVSSPDGRGKCHALKDVTFWATFFCEMLPMRLRDALHLASVAYGEDSPGFKSVMIEIDRRQALCVARTRHLLTPEFAKIWEANAESEPAPNYDEIKAYAEAMLAKLRKETPHRPRIVIACPSGRTWEATTGNCIAAMAAHSAIHGIDIAMLNVQSSDISHGRNMTVEIARREGAYAVCWIDSDMKFPPDLLIRLMKHDVQVCGALYCKRVPDKDGKYPILGKLAGPKPSSLTDGLHEALIMPGGLMFVRMSVYDKLGWPYYAFAYRWPIDDGLESFKMLMRNYFSSEPPEEVLAELDGTRFGEWMRKGNTLGEFGEEAQTFSEDNWFCRRCRKVGIPIFADIKLTGECAHLGELPVSCLLGPEIVRLQEAAD